MDRSIEEKRQHVAEVAREYRQQGYEVTINPDHSRLPDFLAPFSVDLIAQNDAENVVVEVRSRASFGEAPSLAAIAQALADKKDWRFDLVAINNYQHLRLDNTALLQGSDVDYRLNEARQLAAQEYGEAAILLTWSALEAMLRNTAQEEQLASSEENSSYLLKNLFTYGLLDKEQLQVLQKGLQVRDVIVHGYKPQESIAKLLTNLLHVADQLANTKMAA